MNPRIVTQPTYEPVTLGEAYQHLRIDYDSDTPEDSTLINAYITAARVYCENFLGMTLPKKVLELNVLESADEVYLPNGPILSVTQATYETYETVQNSDGDDEILPTEHETTYTLNTFTGKVSGFGVKPTATNNFKIRYEAGFEESSPIPKDIKIAMLLLIGHYYEHREEASEKPLSSIPNGVDSILRPNRIRLGMA
jgi:uncharacterized phiE125 gp8 family phage protein